MKQMSFAQAEHQNNKKVTRREVFPTRLIFLIQFSDSGIVGRLFDQAPHEVTKTIKKLGHTHKQSIKTASLLCY